MIATTEGINQLIRNNKHTIDVGKISDGYHTFDELYEHRIELWIAICRIHSEQKEMHTTLGWYKDVWRAKKHSDGSNFKGWFILGMSFVETPYTKYADNPRQITYHLPISKWEDCDFAQTLNKAPKFDGHTSEQVLERLKNL